MALIKSLGMYFKLNREQKAFIRNKGFERKASIPRLIHFLEPLCAYDEVSDKVSKVIGKMLTFFFLSLFFVIFLGSILADKIPLSVVFGLLGIIAIVVIALVILFFIFKKIDINNNLRNVVLPMLHILAMEVGNRKSVQLKLNFNKALNKQSLHEVEKKRTLFSRSETLFFAYDFLDLSCTFFDGTRLQWKVFDRIRKRTRSNGRKYKTKYKLKRRIISQLSFSQKSYSVVPNRTYRHGKMKEDKDKIVFKSTIKQNADGLFADIDKTALLNTVARPYQFVTSRGSAQ